MRSLNELKQHVFGGTSASERGTSTSSHGSDGSHRSVVVTPESRTGASSDSASTAETIHDNIMKQSQLVLNNIDDVPGVNKPRAPVVNWQDVCQSIASQLVSESERAVSVPLDTTKVMPLFNVMLKELDMGVEPPTIARPDPHCLPRQVLGLAMTMESELGLSSTNGSSAQFSSTPAAGLTPIDSIRAEVHSDDRSSTSSDRQPVDHEKLNREYEELKKKRLFMLMQAYTGTPDPDALLARARGQAGVATPATNCSKVVSQIDGSDGETEAVKKLEASRARMYAMKEKLRLNQSKKYHITNGSGDNVVLGDASQSKLDLNSRRRLAEAMSMQVVPQRQNIAVARPWKKNVEPLQPHTKPNCFFSKPLMSSSPREESSHTSYTEASQSVRSTQPMYQQQQRQIYPHKKGYMSAEEFADENFNSDIASNPESENYVDDGVRYPPRVNGGNWLTQQRRVPCEKDRVYWTQGDRYVVDGSYGDMTQYDDTLNRSMESLLSSRCDDNAVDRVHRWQLTRQAQSCWNLTNCHAYKGVSPREERGRPEMTIPERCRGLTQHSQSLVDISSSRQSLINASETDSRLDTSAHSATELHYTDVSRQEGDNVDTSAFSDDYPRSVMQNPRSAMQNPRSAMQNPCSVMQEPRSAMQNIELRRHPDNVYHVQERHRDSNHAYSKDEDLIANVNHSRLTFEQARDERLKSYGQHADTRGRMYNGKCQPNVENSADNSAKVGNANWSSYYQRRCKALKDSGQEILSPIGQPNNENRISTESRQVAFKGVENNQNLTGGDGNYRDRLTTRDESRRLAEGEDVRNSMSGAQGTPTCQVTSRELYASPKCGDVRTNSYSQGDHTKTVTFSDGSSEARRKLVYADAPQNDYTARQKGSTSGYGCRKQKTEHPSDEKAKAVEIRPTTRRWDDTKDSQTVRSNSHTGCSRDKERFLDDEVLVEPHCRVSGPLKEQHVQMLNGRRLSVQKDDDSSTSMSEVDFVVMRSGDIVRRKKSKDGKNDTPVTRDTDGGEDAENLDVIAESRRCLEDEDDYLGDYKCLQLVSRNTKTDNNKNDSESKRHVGFSSKDGRSEEPHRAEPRRHDKSKSTGVDKQDDTGSVANTLPLKRSATAALQLERDLVAAGKLMEEIEKCKMADLNVGKRPTDTVADDAKLVTPANVRTSDPKLDLGDRQTQGAALADASNKEKSSPSEAKRRNEDTPQKKEIQSTSDETKENDPEVAQR